MSGRYQVRTNQIVSGERFPLLIDRATGKPLFDPTTFLANQMRSSGLAMAMMTRAARAIMAGLRILEHQGVDFSSRLREGRMLELCEITELTEKMHLPQEQIDAHIPATSTGRTDSKVISIKRSQKRSPKPPNSELVHRGTAGRGNAKQRY